MNLHLWEGSLVNVHSLHALHRQKYRDCQLCWAPDWNGLPMHLFLSQHCGSSQTGVHQAMSRCHSIVQVTTELNLGEINTLPLDAPGGFLEHLHLLYHFFCAKAQVFPKTEAHLQRERGCATENHNQISIKVISIEKKGQDRKCRKCR